MIVILNNKTHVGANPPSDTTKTWISTDMTEISIYPEPETYGRLNERIDVKAILLEHNLDIKSNRIRIFSLADDVLEVKRYINGEWVVVDNPDNYVDIIMNGKVIGTMEVDSIAPGESVAEWDGTGVVIEAIEEEPTDELAGTWVFNSSPNITAARSWDVLFTYGDFVDINYGISTRYSSSVQLIQYKDEYGDFQTAYHSTSGWVNDSLKTIHITSKLSEVTNGDILLTWLKANAKKRDASSEPGDGTDPEPV